MGRVMLANCKKVFLTTPLESQRMTYERYWEINHPQYVSSNFPVAVGHFKMNRGRGRRSVFV